MQVWTGSTNFTDTGFFGQTNVGHQVADAKLARTYLDYWTELAEDPVHSKALKNAIDLTANPANVLAKSSTTAFFSPRKADNMRDWYGQRIAYLRRGAVQAGANSPPFASSAHASRRLRNLTFDS